MTTGWTVVFDKFPHEAYETELRYDLQRAVSCWVETTDGVPLDSYTDLVENRSDDTRCADALLWFDKNGTDTAERHVFDDGRDYMNKTAGVSVLNPPGLDYASGIVALDGTPTKRLWELALGERRLNHRPILGEDERTEYIRDTLSLNLVRPPSASNPTATRTTCTPPRTPPSSKRSPRNTASGTTINRRVKKAAEHAPDLNPEDAQPHSLRATAATYHAGRGLELLPLIQMMGWAQPQTAEIYIGRNGTNTARQLDAIHST